jgi:hypothetical protein
MSPMCVRWKPQPYGKEKAGGPDRPFHRGSVTEAPPKIESNNFVRITMPQRSFRLVVADPQHWLGSSNRGKPDTSSPLKR